MIHHEFQIIQSVKKDFPDSDKHRFDSAMDELAQDKWFVSLPIEHSIYSDSPYKPTHEKEIFTTKWYFKAAFNDENKLSKSFSIFVISTPQDVIDCLYKYGFLTVLGVTTNDDDGNDYYQLRLFPNNDCYGNIIPPSSSYH